MVLGKTHQRKTIGVIIIVIGASILVAMLVFGILTLVNKINSKDEYSSDSEASTQEKSEKVETIEEEIAEPEIPRIDFQPVVDEWVKTVGGNKSVLIYDLDLDEIVGEYNTSENYSTASLYKLFVVYEGYRKIQSGEWRAESPAGSTGYNIQECLDLAIRRSHSPCAETLWGMIGRNNLDEIITNNYEIRNSDISRLISNPADIMKMMKIFYEHKDITNDDLVVKMKDSFLNQPVTEYNWRQGLPSGFTKANVYNKVGWDYNPDGGYWSIYHDAAIIEFPEQNRHFIVVVMTSRVPFQQIAKLGTMIENMVISK